MYEYSFGRASSISGVDFGCAIRACDSSEDRTEEASSGMGSSGLADCLSRGRNGLYGCGCLIRESVKAGISRPDQ
jgi:hypothetical protein